MTVATGIHFFFAAMLCLAGAAPPAVAGRQAVTPPAAPPVVTGLPDFTNLIDRVGPAVVDIRTTERIRSGQGGSTEEELMQEFLRRFFGGAPGPPGPQLRRGPPEERVQRGVGSGFIISRDGYVLTNAHVVAGADEVLVTLTDRREYKAKVLGTDERSDVALLKVAASGLPYLAMGDPSKIRVGEWVIAIGSPFNLNNTVTAGIISAKARDTGEYLPLIQSDVAVNPGNSGGPLINMRGEVIGINSQIATMSGAYNGISFAVPIDEVMRVADQIRKTGKVTRGRLGVQIGEVSKEVAESLGLGKVRGVEVSIVEAGGPAAKAGLQVGDIIVKFNGAAIERPSDLPRLVGATPVGSRATVTVWRKGAQQDFNVTIAEAEGDKAAAKPDAPGKGEPAVNALGLQVADLSAAQRRELKLERGVLVRASDAAAARAGVRPGDLILQINNTEVRDARQFNAIVSKLDPKKNVALLVRRGEATQYVVVRPRE
ncbi:DegQ family serine endoprotease [Massilia glaciei]|uniref:Probable periplasmic serine endoprotease DegP-like n=1 Tax=Massilia glaciei TaxID=1524097 RepID=A0A2U2HFJ6_9BURK|nr:DegQ family serine endoprotease [Massilia glaciei]PWF43135.1 DegQ family serine endoprotease [Massilia glaciei]